MLLKQFMGKIQSELPLWLGNVSAVKNVNWIPLSQTKHFIPICLEELKPINSCQSIQLGELEWRWRNASKSVPRSFERSSLWILRPSRCSTIGGRASNVAHVLKNMLEKPFQSFLNKKADHINKDVNCWLINLKP